MTDTRFIEPKPGYSVPCIRCDKPLVNIDRYGDTVELFPEAFNHPFDAVCFTGSGQYGSTTFDPMDGSRLEINLCDECVSKVAQSHIMYFKPKPVEAFVPMDPDDLTQLRSKVLQEAKSTLGDVDQRIQATKEKITKIQDRIQSTGRKLLGH